MKLIKSFCASVSGKTLVRAFMLLAFVSLLVGRVHATGTVDTDVQSMLDNAAATWTAGKTLILSIAGFVVGLSIFWLAFAKARSKR
jgi:hypothetical protein